MGDFSDRPVVIGGNGHSGTRVFTEIVTLGGVFTGLNGVTKQSSSGDLNIIGLLTKWVGPYVYQTMTEASRTDMRRAFARRLRLYFPIRRIRWGFKNPRTMLLLPFLNEMFPGMKFIHVIRDGRDISLGNKFVANNRYADAFLEGNEKQLSPEEKMILFWGRSNAHAAEYAERNMPGRYLRMRWEDLCMQPVANTMKLLEFASSKTGKTETIATVIRKPESLGRWRSFSEDMQARITARGEDWLSRFGYL